MVEILVALLMSTGWACLILGAMVMLHGIILCECVEKNFDPTESTAAAGLRCLVVGWAAVAFGMAHCLCVPVAVALDGYQGVTKSEYYVMASAYVYALTAFWAGGGIMGLWAHWSHTGENACRRIDYLVAKAQRRIRAGEGVSVDDVLLLERRCLMLEARKNRVAQAVVVLGTAGL